MTATRYVFGDAAEPGHPTDRANLADAAARAAALASVLEHVSATAGPIDPAIRFELIAASRDLAERVRAVAL